MGKLEEARILKKGLSTAILNRAYDHTFKGSVLHRYIVRTWKNPKISGSDNYPPQFLVDLVNDPSHRTCSITGNAMKWKGWKTRDLCLDTYFVNEEESLVRVPRAAGPEEVGSSDTISKKRKIEEVDREGEEYRPTLPLRRQLFK